MKITAAGEAVHIMAAKLAKERKQINPQHKALLA